MNVAKRGRSGQIGQRSAGAGAPRSGGRTAARRTSPVGDRVDPVGGYMTQGSAALQDPIGIPDEVPRSARLRVAPPVPVAVPRAPFIAMILVVVVGGVLGVLLVNTKINENAIRIGNLEQQQSNLDIQEQQLEKEIAQHESPGNLAAQARKLGLVESGPPAFIRLPDGRVIGVPQPATGEPAITSQGAGE
ncbi:hypothetical protein ACN27F_30330 [Solwaraspora sp. WMMB335]|uniref:hypothetical protein n=1 Tax=Solwaraspora sp. WMMB335 TaxID=3404118 RepID=UPI003B956F62